MPLDLHTEVEKLRTWLATNRCVDEYEHWWSESGIVSALNDFLAGVAPQDWSDDDVTDLLYILEQSSTGYIAELLTRTEPMALAIARHSLARGGIGSDDIAEQLGYCIEHRDEARALLMAFTQDQHESTRRLAALSLSKLQSAADLALPSGSGNEGPRQD